MAGRPRSTRKLKQWMEEQVDGGDCPGLVWEDRDQGMFRIPWKHAGKQDYRHDEDAAIFKAWAKFKGKYKEGDKADPATWKTRLRCALNKSCEFEEVPARSQLDISEPYKVYRIVEACAEKREAAPLLSLDSVKVKRERRSTWGDADTHGETETPGETTTQMGIKTEELDSGCDLGSGSEGSGQEEGSRGSPFLTWTAQPSPHDDANTDPLINTVTPTPSPSETEPNALSVRIRYGGTLMCRAVTPHGCRICWCPGPYRSEGPGFGSQSLARLRFPPASRVGDPAQQSATAELLPFLERGVMLDSSGHGIFGQRLCQGRVYWRGPANAGPRNPTHGPGGAHTLLAGHKLERDRVEKLFDRQLFIQQLERYRRGEDSLPQHQVTLCFGEELNPGETADRKLITVEVHQVAVEKMVDEELEIQNSAFLLLEPLLPVLPEAGEVYPTPLALSPLYSSP